MDHARAFLKTGVFPALLVLLLATLPFYTPPYTVVALTSILMYVVLTVSWAMFCGPTRYMSLATATFFGVGMYTSAVLGERLPFPLVVACGGLFSFCIGLLTGLICLRLRGFYFAIFTFGLNELVRNSVLWWEARVAHTVGRWLVLVESLTIYYYMLAIVSLTVFVTFLLARSRYGLILYSIGEEEEAAAHIGINVTLYRILFFALSCLFMGLAGAVMATKWAYIDPRIAFNPILNFTPVLMALFGGIGKIYGPILGAGILTLVSEVLLSRFPYYYMLMYGIIFIVIISFLPDGLVGFMKKWRKAPAVAESIK
jgi:branched-chain amino acid transport system permease protein